MKIYISGPITNCQDYKQNFTYHAAKLRAKGHQVLDPTVWDREKLHLKYNEYMALDLAMLSVCDAIYMLPGWTDSHGAKVELDKAVEMGKRIYHASDNNVPAVTKIYRKRI